jgi:hypothetical protein
LDDLNFIAQIKDEPLALVMLGIMAAFKALELLAKHGPPFFNWIFFRGREEPVEKMGQKTWQGFIGKRIDGIEQKIEALLGTVTSIRKFQGKISQGTLENMLFNERLSAFKRLKAFRRLLAMGVNGEIKQEGLKLVLANKETWKIVLQTKLGVKIKDPKYYEESLAYINRLVFENFAKA